MSLAIVNLKFTYPMMNTLYICWVGIIRLAYKT